MCPLKAENILKVYKHINSDPILCSTVLHVLMYILWVLHKPAATLWLSGDTSKQTEENSIIGVLAHPLVSLRAHALISIKYEVERWADVTFAGPCAADGEVRENGGKSLLLWRVREEGVIPSS